MVITLKIFFTMGKLFLNPSGSVYTNPYKGFFVDGLDLRLLIIKASIEQITDQKQPLSNRGKTENLAPNSKYECVNS